MAHPIPLEKMQAAHKLLAEYKYETRPVARGYANRTLHINLDNNKISQAVFSELDSSKFEWTVYYEN